MRITRRFALISLATLPGMLVATASRSPAADPPMPKLAGVWTWSWKDPKGETHRHVLEVEGAGAKLAARERFDDQEPVRVSKLSLDGRKVRFSVERNGRRADYTGVAADGDTINGTVTITVSSSGQMDEHVWKATRMTRAKVATP